MNRKRLVAGFGFLLVFAINGSGYEEWSLPNLTAPTSLKAPSLELQIQHQFSGSIGGDQAFDRLFGFGDLANVVVGVRADVWSTAQVYASYTNAESLMVSLWQYTVGAAYAVPLPWIFIRTQIDAQFYSYAAANAPYGRTNAGFFDLSIQNNPLFDRLVFLVNGGYDTDQRRFGLGIGADVKIIEKLDLFGSYYPMIDKAPHSATYDQFGKIYNPFYFGLKVTTAGHQFFFYAGNSPDIGTRYAMEGAVDNTLRLGFMIKRLFSFD